MKKLSFSFGKLRQVPTYTKNFISRRRENTASEISSLLNIEDDDFKKEEIIQEKEIVQEEIVQEEIIQEETKELTSRKPRNEESDSIENDENTKDYEYYNKYNYSRSLLNEILLDPVLFYALENGKWDLLRSVKYGSSKDDYEVIKQEMVANGGENIDFDGSLLQKISENYVYFRALERLDVRFLEKLRNGTLLYNDYKKFADNNSIDILHGSLGFKKYHEFIASKNLH